MRLFDRFLREKRLFTGVMRKVKIITDSTSDLPEEMLEERGIEVVPLHIILGDKKIPDDRTFTNEQLFEFADSTGTLPGKAGKMVRSLKLYTIARRPETGGVLLGFSNHNIACYDFTVDLKSPKLFRE